MVRKVDPNNNNSKENYPVSQNTYIFIKKQKHTTILYSSHMVWNK